MVEEMLIGNKDTMPEKSVVDSFMQSQIVDKPKEQCVRDKYDICNDISRLTKMSSTGLSDLVYICDRLLECFNHEVACQKTHVEIVHKKIHDEYEKD